MSTRVPSPDPAQLALQETEDYRMMLDSVHLLGDAIRSLPRPVSPQMAAGVAATENAWQQMEAEFRMLDGPAVARLAGSRQTTGGYANELRRARRAMGVRRRNAYVYPGFQFQSDGSVYPTVLAVLQAAEQLDVSDDGVAQWFCLPSASLDGKRPVDLIGDREGLVERVFRDRFGVEW